MNAPDASSADRIAKAVRWLEPRIEKANRTLLKRYHGRGRAEVSLVVPDKIVRLYQPYALDKPLTVTDSVRELMRRKRFQADFAAPTTGKRNALVFVFRAGPP